MLDPARPGRTPSRVTAYSLCVLMLGLDTATAAVVTGVVRVADDGSRTVVAERIAGDGNGHGELLAPSVRSVLDEAGVELADLDGIVVGLGPGPFTGLRIGVVTAAALGDAAELPVYGVCSHDAIALSVWSAEPSFAGPLLVATDARRREIYWAVYEKSDAVRRTSGPAVDTPALVASKLADTGISRVVGGGVVKYGFVLSSVATDLVDAGPSALGLIEAALPQVDGDVERLELQPLYLRRPDAVEPTRIKAVSQVSFPPPLP